MPQLAGWGLPSDAAARDVKEAKPNERSMVTATEYEAPHLAQPTPVMTTALSRACMPANRPKPDAPIDLLHHGLMFDMGSPTRLTGAGPLDGSVRHDAPAP